MSILALLQQVAPQVVERGFFDRLRGLCELFVPNEAGALAIGFLVTFLVAGDLKRIVSRRNGAVLGILAIAPTFLGIRTWGEQVDAPGGMRRAAFLFSAVFVVTLAYVVWSLLLARRKDGSDWEPNLPLPGLKLLCVFLLLLNVAVAFGRRPDDAGYYTNLGAQRWIETGTLPYGDPGLRGPDAPGFGAAATYGPMLYAAHVPWVALAGTARNAPEAKPIQKSYRRPPLWTTQLTSLLFQLVGCGALFLIGRRLAGASVGLALVAMYAAHPCVLGMGGERTVIGGLAFVSHIAPSATVSLALLAHAVPALAGALLALAAGVLFYPAFLFPAWFGHFLGKGRAAPFLVGFAVCGLLVGGLVVGCTDTAEDENAVGLFLKSTLEHQEGGESREYGASKFSFWGTHPGWAKVFQTPLFGDSSLFKATFLGFAALAFAAFFLARGRDVARLAALTAMVAAAVQLWKTHATGSYVEWYLPLLLIAVFARPGVGAELDDGGGG